MSRSSQVQSLGNSRQKIECPNTAPLEDNMCQCGLSCGDVCYRKQFNELVDLLACNDIHTFDDSSMAITVSTSGRRTVQSGEQLALKKNRRDKDNFTSIREVADSSSSGSRTSSTTSGIRNQSDDSQTREAPPFTDPVTRNLSCFRETDLLDPRV